MIAQFEEYDRKIFWALVAVGAAAIFLYAYLLSISVIAVIARKDAEREVRRMTAQVATLESEYALLDRSIDLKLAHDRGFVDVATQKYILTGAKENVLSLRSGSSGN